MSTEYGLAYIHTKPIVLSYTSLTMGNTLPIS